MHVGRTTDDLVVAEAVVKVGGVTVDELVARATVAHADVVWAHGRELAAHGFVRAPGYARLRSDVRPRRRGTLGAAGVELDVEVVDDGPELRTEAYLGLWGHKRVDPAASRAGREEMDAAGCITFALRANGALIGLCDAFPRERLVDGPGVVVAHRGVGAKLRLLEAACDALGPGRIELDTWGEDAEVLGAYVRLGFAIEVEAAGWELRRGA